MNQRNGSTEEIHYLWGFVKLVIFHRELTAACRYMTEKTNLIQA